MPSMSEVGFAFLGVDRLERSDERVLFGGKGGMNNNMNEEVKKLEENVRGRQINNAETIPPRLSRLEFMMARLTVELAQLGKVKGVEEEKEKKKVSEKMKEKRSVFEKGEKENLEENKKKLEFLEKLLERVKKEIGRLSNKNNNEDKKN